MLPNKGEVPEWSIGAVSKTVDLLWGSQGSNPCLSANTNSQVLSYKLVSFFISFGSYDISD